MEPITPGIVLERPGVLTFLTRGPSRYFGGDDALASARARRARRCRRDGRSGGHRRRRVRRPARGPDAGSGERPVIERTAHRRSSRRGRWPCCESTPRKRGRPARPAGAPRPAHARRFRRAPGAVGTGALRRGGRGRTAWPRGSRSTPPARRRPRPIWWRPTSSTRRPRGSTKPRSRRKGSPTDCSRASRRSGSRARTSRWKPRPSTASTSAGAGATRAHSPPAALVARVRWQLDGWLTGMPAPACRWTRAIPSSRARAEGLGRRGAAAARARAGDPGHGSSAGVLGRGRRRRTDRADRVLARLQGMLGHDAVATPVVVGGRAPSERVRWVPWGEPATGRRFPSNHGRARCRGRHRRGSTRRRSPRSCSTPTIGGSPSPAGGRRRGNRRGCGAPRSRGGRRGDRLGGTVGPRRPVVGSFPSSPAGVVASRGRRGANRGWQWSSDEHELACLVAVERGRARNRGGLRLRRLGRLDHDRDRKRRFPPTFQATRARAGTCRTRGCGRARPRPFLDRARGHVAAYVVSPNRTVTAGSAWRFRTQSESVPPPASRYSVCRVPVLGSQEREPDLDLVGSPAHAAPRRQVAEVVLRMGRQLAHPATTSRRSTSSCRSTSWTSSAAWRSSWLSWNGRLLEEVDFLEAVAFLVEREVAARAAWVRFAWRNAGKALGMIASRTAGGALRSPPVWPTLNTRSGRLWPIIDRPHRHSVEKRFPNPLRNDEVHEQPHHPARESAQAELPDAGDGAEPPDGGHAAEVAVREALRRLAAQTARDGARGVQAALHRDLGHPG